MDLIKTIKVKEKKRSTTDRAIDNKVTTAVAVLKSSDDGNPDKLCLRREHLLELIGISDKVDKLNRNERFAPFIPGAHKKACDLSAEGVQQADVEIFITVNAEMAVELIEESKEIGCPVECYSLTDVRSLLNLQSVTNLKKYLEKYGRLIPEEVGSLLSVDEEYEQLLAKFKVPRRTRVAIARRKQKKIDLLKE